MQALPKGDRGELAVELLTEIGCRRSSRGPASRSVAVWKGERAVKSLARWRSTARGRQQAGRAGRGSRSSEPATTSDVAALLAGADLGVVLHEQAAVPLASLDVPASGRIVVVVGPEEVSPTRRSRRSPPPAPSRSSSAPRCAHSTASVASVAALLAPAGDLSLVHA